MAYQWRAVVLALVAGAGPLAVGEPTPFAQQPALDLERHLRAPLRVTAEDLTIHLTEGVGLVAMAGSRPAAIVLVGRGRMECAPPVRSEQRQLEMFAGATRLEAEFDEAVVRLHPSAFAASIQPATLHTGPAARPLAARAEAVFREALSRSLGATPPGPLAAGDALLLPPGDVLAEVHTTRLGRLTYARVSGEPEDIMLIDERQRRVAAYPSASRRLDEGFSWGDEYGLPYEALHYDVRATIGAGSIVGRARILIRAVEALGTVDLRLDRALTVTDARSLDTALAFRQPAESDRVLVRLPQPLPRDATTTLEIAFGGRARPQVLAPEREPAAGYELYSNRSYWFPQSPVRNHATAELRLTVPAGQTVVATGVPVQTPERQAQPGREAGFKTSVPVRYLSLLSGRFETVADVAPPAGAAPHVRVLATGSQRSRARASVPEIERIVRFYSARVGDVPFPNLTVVYVDSPVPAAHSPAYLAVVGEPRGWNPASAADDPAYYRDEPVFFLAHEIAHQWWGQAVGWRHYREQWLSEAFAQYFAALYIRETRGEEAFARVLGWMRRWARRAAGRGPISLGIRVGQFAGDPHAFVAAVYNRGACILHMLRQLLGEEVFLRGLRLYYQRWKHRRASTSDLRQSLEDASGVELRRFFDQWIFDDGEPRLEWTAAAVPDGGRWKLSVRIEQTGQPHELPLAITIEQDGQPAIRDVLHVRGPRHEFVFDLSGRLRRVRLGDDSGVLCELRERR